MNEFVHFAVGVSLGLFILSIVDVSTRKEFLLIFASGVWGMIPDGHWLLREFGLAEMADNWLQFHRSSAANVFWFHRFLDRHETGEPKLETGLALSIMLTMVIHYYFTNDWEKT